MYTMEQYQHPTPHPPPYNNYSEQFRQDQRGPTFPPHPQFSDYAVREGHKQDMEQTRNFNQPEFDNYYGKERRYLNKNKMQEGRNTGQNSI